MSDNTEEPSVKIKVSVPGLIFASIFGTSLPIVATFVWIKKYKGKCCYKVIGALGFLCSFILESIFLYFIGKIYGEESNTFIIITAISPGLFEETTKYLLIRYIYSKDKLKKNAVSYGIGHGGIESFTLGVSLLSQAIAKKALIEKGAIKQSITFIASIMSSLERAFALSLQISFSIFNYRAIKEQKILFYVLAVVFHDIINIIAVLYQRNILTSIYIVELIFGIMAISIFWYSYNLYKSWEEKEEKEEVDITTPLEEKKADSLEQNYNSLNNQ